MPSLDLIIKAVMGSVALGVIMKIYFWVNKIKRDSALVLKDRHEFEMDKIDQTVLDASVDALIASENERRRNTEAK